MSMSSGDIVSRSAYTVFLKQISELQILIHPHILSSAVSYSLNQFHSVCCFQDFKPAVDCPLGKTFLTVQDNGEY